MALKYTLTLTTAAEPGRPATAATSWTLTEQAGPTIIGRGGCPGDPHGDHARIEGRSAAKKHATSLGLRIVDAHVRVVYATKSPAPGQ